MKFVACLLSICLVVGPPVRAADSELDLVLDTPGEFQIAALTPEDTYSLACGINQFMEGMPDFGPDLPSPSIFAERAHALRKSPELQRAAHRLILGVVHNPDRFVSLIAQLQAVRFDDHPHLGRRHARTVRQAAQRLERLSSAYRSRESARAELEQAAREYGLHIPGSGWEIFDGLRSRAGPAAGGGTAVPAQGLEGAAPAWAEAARVQQLAERLAHPPKGQLHDSRKTVDQLIPLMEAIPPGVNPSEVMPVEALLREGMRDFFQDLSRRWSEDAESERAEKLHAGFREKTSAGWVPNARIRGLFAAYQRLIQRVPDAIPQEGIAAIREGFALRLSEGADPEGDALVRWTYQQLMGLAQNLVERRPGRMGAETFRHIGALLDVQKWRILPPGFLLNLASEFSLGSAVLNAQPAILDYLKHMHMGLLRWLGVLALLHLAYDRYQLGNFLRWRGVRRELRLLQGSAVRMAAIEERARPTSWTFGNTGESLSLLLERAPKEVLSDDLRSQLSRLSTPHAGMADFLRFDQAWQGLKSMKMSFFERLTGTVSGLIVLAFGLSIIFMDLWHPELREMAAITAIGVGSAIMAFGIDVTRRLRLWQSDKRNISAMRELLVEMFYLKLVERMSLPPGDVLDQIASVDKNGELEVFRDLKELFQRVEARWPDFKEELRSRASKLSAWTEGEQFEEFDLDDGE